MRRIALIILIFGLVQAASAQVTGYRGKRTALKVNAINGIRPLSLGVDLEYAIGRQSSATIGFLGNQYHPDQITTGDGDLLAPQPTLSGLVYFELRHYGNKILPAPNGVYLSIAGGIGLEQHEFTIVNVRKHIKRTVFGHLSIPSFGYQTTIGRRFLIDFKYATETLLVAQDEDFEYKFLTTNLYSARIQNVIFGPSFYVKLGFLVF